MLLVHLLQQVELTPLDAARHVAVVDVLNELFRIGVRVIDVRALVDAGQKAVAPQLRADDRLTGTEDDVTGQVLVLGAEAVGQPRAEARPRRLRLAGVHHQERRLVVGRVGVHRADDANVVDDLADVREQLADLDAAVALFAEGERRRQQAAALGAVGRQGGAFGRWPLYLSRAGLGSKVSTCDGPPFMNRKMTRLARALNIGGFGARGLSFFGASSARRSPSPASIVARPRAPKPPPIRQSTWRRVIRCCGGKNMVAAPCLR